MCSLFLFNYSLFLIVTTILCTNTIAKYAYVVLIHSMDNTYQYRGYLLSCLVIKHELQHTYSSTADFVALISMKQAHYYNNYIIQHDLSLLSNAGYKLHNLDRIRINNSTNSNNSDTVSNLESFLMKIYVWNMVEYDRIQFLDCDVLPLMNMDCLFLLDINTFISDRASLINAGYFVAIPNKTDYNNLLTLARWRLSNPWNCSKGYGKPIFNFVRFKTRSKTINHWKFHGAELEQGLLVHYFLQMKQIATRYIEYSIVENYNGNCSIITTVDPTNTITVCNRKILPTKAFFHFTGDNKPWIIISKMKRRLYPEVRKMLIRWVSVVSETNIGINSSNLAKYILHSNNQKDNGTILQSIY